MFRVMRFVVLAFCFALEVIPCKSPFAAASILAAVC